ncbi:MAG: hypothetical protein HC936_09880 [Leptolyngbyaceae cyanobacterium SU_3_3]|nr:hypothetical protein [Leptolyngbyaceae cyanobacterium SU_3_3]
MQVNGAIAAQEAGLQDVPVLIWEFDDQQALQVSLIENLQREDLHQRSGLNWRSCFLSLMH